MKWNVSFHISLYLITLYCGIRYTRPLVWLQSKDIKVAQGDALLNVFKVSKSCSGLFSKTSCVSFPHLWQQNSGRGYIRFYVPKLLSDKHFLSLLCSAQLISSSLVHYIASPLAHSGGEGDWQLIFLALTFIPLFSAVSWIPLFQRGRKERIFHWPVDFLKSLCFVHGNGSKNQLNILGFPRACRESLTDLGYHWWVFIKKLFGCQGLLGIGELLCGSAYGCVLIFWLQRLFKLTSYF